MLYYELCLQTHTHIQTHTYIHTHTRTHTCTHTHTHTHKHTHTHTPTYSVLCVSNNVQIRHAWLHHQDVCSFPHITFLGKRTEGEGWCQQGMSSCAPAHVRQLSWPAPWPQGEVGSPCDLQSLGWTLKHLWMEDKGLKLPTILPTIEKRSYNAYVYIL